MRPNEREYVSEIDRRFFLHSDHTVPVAKRGQVRKPVATVNIDESFVVETIRRDNRLG